MKKGIKIFGTFLLLFTMFAISSNPGNLLNTENSTTVKAETPETITVYVSKNGIYHYKHDCCGMKQSTK